MLNPQTQAAEIKNTPFRNKLHGERTAVSTLPVIVPAHSNRLSPNGKAVQSASPDICTNKTANQAKRM
jgi:hypothetical protein